MKDNEFWVNAHYIHPKGQMKVYFSNLTLMIFQKYRRNWCSTETFK